MNNTIHFVLQAKGGIGKSFVSTLLAQHVLAETGAVRCFDTDQENTTFTHYGALKVHHVTVTNGSRRVIQKVAPLGSTSTRKTVWRPQSQMNKSPRYRDGRPLLL